MCENGSPWTIKNHCFSLKGVQISLCPPISKRFTKCHQNTSQNGAEIDKILFLTHLGNYKKNNENQCRKGEEMGAQREPKSNLKSLKKGTQNMFFFLWVPLGAFVALWAPRGVPGAHFLVDFCKCSNVCCPFIVVSLLLFFKNVLV